MGSKSAPSVESVRTQFEANGFAALEGFFSRDQIDVVAAAIARLLADKPNEVVVDNLLNQQRSFWAQATDRQTRFFKLNDLYLLSPEVRNIALDPHLADILSGLVGERAVLCNSLNFEKGSGQLKHIDSLYMTPQTPHSLIASWTAFEDVHPDSGPLVYWPGSHKIPLFRFKDGSHHATPGEQSAWNAYIDGELKARNIREEIFLAKKGDVFIWHSDLVHGGSPIKDQNRTRSSLVCHYFSETDCRGIHSNLVPMHGGFWMDRLPQPVRVDPALFDDANPFPEERYLKRYPDVREAVHAKRLPSGQFHYEKHGYAEGRGL